jgi:hypothetical protein
MHNDVVWTDVMTAQTRQDVNRMLCCCDVALLDVQARLLDQCDQCDQCDQPDQPDQLKPQHMVVCALETHSQELVAEFAELSKAERTVQTSQFVYQLVQISCYKMLVLFRPDIFETCKCESCAHQTNHINYNNHINQIATDQCKQCHDDTIVANIMHFDDQKLKHILKRALLSGCTTRTSGRAHDLYHKLLRDANQS